jgi:hypothetical protein
VSAINLVFLCNIILERAFNQQNLQDGNTTGKGGTSDDVVHLDQWFPNGVSGGTMRCVAKLKNIFKLRLMMIINN